jgi:hypothetical protein
MSKINWDNKNVQNKKKKASLRKVKTVITMRADKGPGLFSYSYLVLVNPSNLQGQKPT